MTDYEKKLHENLFGLIGAGKFQWFAISPDREDREEFIAGIKTFIDLWGCAEFSGDYSRFRVIERVHPDFWPIHNRSICRSFKFPAPAPYKDIKANIEKMRERKLDDIRRDFSFYE